MKKDEFKPAESKGLEWIEEDETGLVSEQYIQHRPQSPSINTTTSQKGLPLGWIRATFIVRQRYLESLKDVAYWERESIKDVLDSILESYFKDKIIRPRKRKTRI